MHLGLICKTIMAICVPWQGVAEAVEFGYDNDSFMEDSRCLFQG